MIAGAGCGLEEVNKFLLAKGHFPAGWFVSEQSVLPVLAAWRKPGDISQKMGFEPTTSAAESKWWMGPESCHNSNEEQDFALGSRGGGNGQFPE